MDDFYSIDPYDINEYNNVKAGITDMYMSAGGKVKNNVRDYGGNATHDYDAEYMPYDQNSLTDTKYLYDGTYGGTYGRGRGRAQCRKDQYKQNGFYASDLKSATGRAAYYLVPEPPMRTISGAAYDAPQRPRLGARDYNTSEDQLRASLYRDGGKGADPSPYFKCDCVTGGQNMDATGLIVATFNIVPMLALLVFILVIIIAATIALSVKLYGFVRDTITSFTS